MAIPTNAQPTPRRLRDTSTHHYVTPEAVYFIGVLKMLQTHTLVVTCLFRQPGIQLVEVTSCVSVRHSQY